MSPLTLALLSIVVATFIIKIIVSIRRRLEKRKIFDKGNIPSIARNDIFAGNILNVLRPSSYVQNLKQYHEQLGNSFGLFYGSDPWLMTRDVKLLHKLLVAEGNKHVDNIQLKLPFVGELNRSIVQVRGNEWRQVRRILNPSFAHRQMKTDNVFRDIEGACAKLLTCIMGYPLESDGRIINVLNIFQKFALETIFGVAFGRENAINMDPGGEDKLIEAIDVAVRSIMNPAVRLSVMFGSLSRPLGFLIQFTKLGHIFKLIHSTTSDCIVDRRRMLKEAEDDVGSDKSQPTRKMIDTLIELVDNKKMDDVTLKANLYMLLMAGFETSANVLTTMFWLLARHPDIQEKLRQAIKHEGEEAIYLDWCIKEALRLFPSVPFAGRVVEEDMTTSQEYWGPDVEEFRPERFGEPLENPLQYLPFGGGPRGCLGKSLAMAEMRAIVTRIMLKFKVETCDSTPDEIVWSAPNFVHTIIEGPIDLRFVESTCL